MIDDRHRGAAQCGRLCGCVSELVGSRLDRVLELFLGVAITALHLAGGLVGDTFGLQLFAARDLARHFLDLALRVLDASCNLVLRIFENGSELGGII